jgi:hypothetical protein
MTTARMEHALELADMAGRGRSSGRDIQNQPGKRWRGLRVWLMLTSNTDFV